MSPLLAAALCLTAQGAPPADVKAIRAGRLIDVDAGKVLTDQVIVVQGGAITAVGPNLAIPAGATVIDLSDATVMPGLIDCHTHLLADFETHLGSDEVNGNLTLFRMNTTMRALLGAKNAREYLRAGVTTVRDLGNSGINGDVALRDAIDRGWVEGPRMLCSTRALSAVGGQFGRLPAESQSFVATEYAQISGPDEARKAVRQAIIDGANLIKVIVDNGALTLSLEEMKAIVHEAHRANCKVAAHAIAPEAVRNSVEAGVDTIEHAYDTVEDAFAGMAKKRIFLVPTDVPTESFVQGRRLTAEELRREKGNLDQFEKLRHSRIQAARRLGVPIAFGSDMYYNWAGRTRGQAAIASLAQYVGAGLTPMETIQTATVSAAEACGWKDRLGRIRARHIADIVAVRKDPLVDIHALERMDFVMKGGRLVVPATR